MHQSAMFYGQKFFETYCYKNLTKKLKIVEIGSKNVNGSLREAAPIGAEYIGLDFDKGEGVDIVIDNPYKIPLADEMADVVLSSSCFEHSEFFWVVYLEAIRILKPGGLLYLNVPSNGFFHRWPVDCWRFYPDSGAALARWGYFNNKDTVLLESFIGRRSSGLISEGGMWSDFVAVILKNSNYSDSHPNRIINSIDGFENGHVLGSNDILNPNQLGSDFLFIEEQRKSILGLERDLNEAKQQAIELNRILSEMQDSLSWRLMYFFRLFGKILRAKIGWITRLKK